MVRHAMLMMAGTLVSRVLGLAREVLVAAFFGATRSLLFVYNLTDDSPAETRVMHILTK